LPHARAHNLRVFGSVPGKQQRRGLARHTSHAEDHARHDALAAGTHRKMVRVLLAPSASEPSRSELGTPRRTVSWPEGRWESSSGSGRSRRPRAEVVHGHNDHRPGENSDDDGGHAVQQIAVVAYQTSARFCRELRQVDAAQESRWNADGAAIRINTHCHIALAIPLALRPERGQLGEKTEIDGAPAIHYQIAQVSGTEPTR